MTPSDDLFYLIRSLSKAEKRYFKLFASQHTRNRSNNYITLFEEVDRLRDYDEEKLKARLKGKPAGKKLAATKYLLYELILKMLRCYHSGKTIESRLNNLMDEAELLYAKTLYSQGIKILAKAKKLATEAGKTAYLVKISIMERKFSSYTGYSRKAEKSKRWLESSELLITRLQSETQYLLLAEKMRMFYELCMHKGGTCNRKAALQIMKHPLLAGPDLAQTFISRICLFEIRSLFAKINNRHSAAARELMAIANLWEKNPKMINVYPDCHQRTMSDLVLTGLNAGEYGIYPVIIRRIKSVGRRTEQDATKRNFWVRILEFAHHLHQSDLQKCSDLELDLLEYHEKHEQKMSPVSLMQLYFHLSIFYFMKGNYNDSIDWMNKVQAYEKTALMPSIQIFCKLLQIPVHFELKNFNFLEYQLRSTQRFLERRNWKGEGDANFLRLMKKSLNAVGANNLQSLFVQLRKSFVETDASGFQHLSLGEKAMRFWINNKTRNAVA